MAEFNLSDTIQRLRSDIHKQYGSSYNLTTSVLRRWLKECQNEIKSNDYTKIADVILKLAKGGTINVYRTWQTDLSTISTFTTDDGKIKGYILEPPGPATTIANKNKRIPAGTYYLTPHINSHLHSKYQLYNHLVPISRYILLHVGNYPDDTQGCLLPGSSKSVDRVWASGPILNQLNNYIKSLKGNVKIVIHEPSKS